MERNSDFKYDLEFGIQEGEEWFKRLVEAKEGTVEVKCDRKAKETGNMFIEYESRYKPSGISTTKATHWVYKFDEETAIIFSTDKLKARLKELIKEGKVKMNIRGGDNNTSVGLLVKIKDLF